MKKISITLLTLSLTSVIAGQNATGNANGAAKDGQYENQYKTSNNFYINSDGLVVYKRSNSVSQEDSNANTSYKEPVTSTRSTVHDSSSYEQEQPKSSPVIVRKEAYTNTETQYKTNKEPDPNPVLTRPAKKDPVNVNEYSAEKRDPAPYTPPAPKSSGTVKKQALTVDESISLNSAPPVNNSNEGTVNYEAVNNSTKKSKNSTGSEITQEEAKKKYKKYNTYEKRPSTYKSIEEAALAVDAMIEELKKNQTQTSGARSMSSRLSTGANRASLRKKPISSSFSSSYGYSTTPVSKPGTSTTTTTANEIDSAWGDEPTYYINGTEVDRSDVDVLRKKDIIRKEFKIRNTASGNPNGEVWYEVRDYQR